MTNEINGAFYDVPNDPRIGSTTITGGSAVVQITDNGLSTGNGYLQAAGTYFVNAWINSSGNSYPCQGVLSNSNKTLTLGANQQGVNLLSTVLGLLVTGISYNAVPNGTVVNYYILGPLA